MGKNVETIYSTDYAFAAKLTNGSIVTWSDPYFGGDSSGVEHHLKKQVETIYSTISTFAAKLKDGSVVTWEKGGESRQLLKNVESLKKIYC